MKKLSLLFGILEQKIQIWDVFPRSTEQDFLTVRARLAQYEPKAQQGTQKKIKHNIEQKGEMARKWGL